MTDYTLPRPTSTTSATSPAALNDNAVTFNKLLNDLENQTTYQGKELISWQNAIKLFGFGVATFDFASGGTLDSKNQLIRHSDELLYRYIGAGSFPLTVAPGTNPVGNPDWEAFTATAHNLLSGRNAVGAHDTIYDRRTTVAEIASGVFTEDGEVLTVADRADGKFRLTLGGTPNGFDILDAGNGNTAVIVNPIYLEHFGLALDGVIPDDDGFEAAYNVINDIKLLDNSKTLYLTRKHDIRNKFFFRIDLSGATLKLDLTTVTSVQTVADSLDYAFYFDGIGYLDIGHFDVEFGTVSQYTGIHRTMAVSETVGDSGCGWVDMHHVNINGGFSAIGSSGGLFINNKISKGFEFHHIKWDNATYPSGYSQSYRVLINCELRDQNLATESTMPTNVHYHDIEMRNANAPDSDGMLRIAGVHNATIERVLSVGISKPIKVRTQDNMNVIAGEFSENTVIIRNNKLIDFADWAINADTLNNNNFKPYRVTIENNVFDILDDPFGGTHYGVYILPMHNVHVLRNTFKRLDSDFRLRTFSAGESLPRGTDKTFANLSYCHNKSFGCKDRAVTANDFTTTYSGYGFVSGFTILDNEFSGGSAAQAYLHIEQLNDSRIHSNKIGYAGASEPVRAINIGSANLSNDVWIYDNSIDGVYGASPLVYSNAAQEWLGNNYIFDNSFSDTDQPFTYAVARPNNQNRIWYSPSNTAPSPSEAESAGMRLGERIDGVAQAASITSWYVTDVTPAAFVIKSNVKALA